VEPGSASLVVSPSAVTDNADRGRLG